MSKRNTDLVKLKHLFPLNNVGKVFDLFKAALELDSPPDLTFLSLIIGFIEDRLTSTSAANNQKANAKNEEAKLNSEKSDDTKDDTGNILRNFSCSPIERGKKANPICLFTESEAKEKEENSPRKIVDIYELEIPGVRWEVIDVLYKNFASQIKDGVELKQSSKRANRDLIHKVSDVIWSNLTRNYKDKAHQQTLYSYMVGDKLDRFGVAYAVVAACQILGLDVRLVLSEDHAWVTFGAEALDQSAEVTWHGMAFLPDENYKNFLFLIFREREQG